MKVKWLLYCLRVKLPDVSEFDDAQEDLYVSTAYESLGSATPPPVVERSPGLCARVMNFLCCYIEESKITR